MVTRQVPKVFKKATPSNRMPQSCIVQFNSFKGHPNNGNTISVVSKKEGNRGLPFLEKKVRVKKESERRECCIFTFYF